MSYNWRIFIRKYQGKLHRLRGKPVPTVLQDLGEGPFKTKRDAMLFGNAEVYGEWFVAEVRPARREKKYDEARFNITVQSARKMPTKTLLAVGKALHFIAQDEINKRKPMINPKPRESDNGVRRRYLGAAPNPMFTELTRACIRFVRYEEKVPCALCGKQSKKHWTCVVRFKAADLGKCIAVVKLSPKYFTAGTPVCEDHPTQPDENEFLRKVRAAQAAQKKAKK